MRLIKMKLPAKANTMRSMDIFSTSVALVTVLIKDKHPFSGKQDFIIPTDLSVMGSGRENSSGIPPKILSSGRYDRPYRGGRY
jgi:hypothetical protein